MTLDNIHIDILDQIFNEMYSPYLYLWDERWHDECSTRRMPAAGLLQLSLVSKRMRALVLPWIFRDVTFSLNVPRKFLPRHLWQYIDTFRFSDLNMFHISRYKESRKAMYIQSRNEVFLYLPQLSRIHTLHLWLSSFPAGFIDKLAPLPRLSSLALYNYPLMVDEDNLFGRFQGIHRLIHVETITRWTHTSDEPRHEILGKQFFAIIQSCASSLVHLDIPANYSRLDELGNLQMTSLRTLILRGRMQSPHPNLLWAILNAAPSLRVLEIHLFVLGMDMTQFMVMNEDVDATPEDQRVRMLSNLRELTLANAHPNDHIFRYLPPDLQLFSLPSVTIFVQGRGQSWLTLSANAASHILTKQNLSYLVEFRISVEGELPPWLFVMAAEAFPLLHILEVRHRLRKGDDGDEVKETEYSPEAYAMAFASFSCLQVLNLDWPLTNVGNPDDYPPPRRRNIPPPSPPDHRRPFATLVAQSVESLLRIGFREPMTMTAQHRLPWLQFAVERFGTDSLIVVTQLDNIRPDEAELLQILESRTETSSPEPLQSSHNHISFEPIIITIDSEYESS